MKKSILFRKLLRDYGMFYMFSEYAESLTRNNAEGDAFRLVPSKFAAFDIDYSLVSTSGKIPDTNIHRASVAFQNYYENCINIFRQANSEGWNYTPEIAKHKLYETLAHFDFIHTEYIYEDPEDTSSDIIGSYWRELKYIGDVDIVSNSIVDGINYSELYCMIPANAHAKRYFLDPISEHEAPEVDYTDLQEYISGWTSETYPTTPGILGHTPLFDDYDLQDLGYYSLDECGYPKLLYNNNMDTQMENAPYEETDENPFHVNTIIVFYDIVVKDESGNYNTIYYNVPMGVYFTGWIDDDNNTYHNLTNYITKYIHSSEAYNQGTSYGLRITTKMTVMPSFESMVNTIDVEVENLYPEFARVCEGFLEAVDAMDDMTSQSTEYLNTLKDYLAYFKDRKTNVPYIMNLGTSDNPAYYWFVNGRNTGVRVVNNDDVLTLIEQLTLRVHDLEEIIGADYPNYTDFDPMQIAFGSISGNNSIGVPGGVKRLSADDIRNFTHKDHVQNINIYYDICPLYGLDATDLFNGYSSLRAIPHLDIFNVTTMERMFRNCESIISVDLSNSVNSTSFNACFENCQSLKTVRLDMTSINSASAITNIFKGCESLENIYIDNLSVPANTNITLDLSDTMCNTSSLLYILEHIGGERYNPDTITHTLRISLPENLDADSKEIEDMVFLVSQNKHVDILFV